MVVQGPGSDKLKHDPAHPFAKSMRKDGAPSGFLTLAVELRGKDGPPADGNPNNSSPQGQIFYANIGSSNSPPHYDLYPVDDCTSAEGVGNGTVPGFYPKNFTQAPAGFDAIIDDMVGNTTHNIPAQCFHGVHQQ